jgi:hypothetical protein
MRRSTKAVLISGLVLPGLGHVFLRSYVVGLVLLCVAGWSIYSIATTAIGAALDVAREIESGSMAIDSASISQLVTQRSKQAEDSTNVPVLALLLSWVVGIIDSYRVGRAQDRLEKTPVKKKT